MGWNDWPPQPFPRKATDHACPDCGATLYLVPPSTMVVCDNCQAEAKFIVPKEGTSE